MSELAVAAAFKSARARFVIANDAIRRVFDLNKIEVIVGRDKAADSGVDCLIEHAAVSGKHAKIRFDRQRFFIEDLGSKNGTFLGSEMLPAGAPRELRPETHVKFGGVDALFVVDCDADGKKIAPLRYQAAADVLEMDGRVTKTQRAGAERDIAEKVHGDRHVGEVLLLRGLINVEQWIDAIKRAEIMDLSKKAVKQSSGGARAVAVILAVAAIVAILLFVFRSKIFGS
jgi:hypothetical protein